MISAQVREQRISELSFDVSGSRTARRGSLRAFREVLAHRELLDLLVRRELKSRYKDSSLGFLWSLIRPLTLLLIYWVAIGHFLGAARGVPDFAIFVFCGLTLWGLYSEIVTAGTNSVIANGGLIKKVYLPREIFPLASVGSALFNFAIQMVVLVVGVSVLAHWRFDWDLLYVPVGVVLALIYGLALALLFSALNVYLRDVQYLVEVAMLILFWASPIVYPWSSVANSASNLSAPWIAGIYLSNPTTISVMAFQRGIWAAGSETHRIGANIVPPQPWPADMDIRLLVTAIVGVLLLWVGQRVFSRLQGNFAQEI